MTRTGKILLGLLGTALVGGVAAAALSSGGGSPPPNPDPNPDIPPDPDNPVEPPKQDAPLERPGYKVLPNCGGFEITDVAAARKYARDLVASVPAANWPEAVALELYGPVCAQLGTDEYKAVTKVAANFLYGQTRAVLQGAIGVGYYTEAQAEEALAKVREAMAAQGAPKADLVPVTVWG
jgi:enamine deaminase RidA (YjgF/YER057c/UK114 family)